MFLTLTLFFGLASSAQQTTSELSSAIISISLLSAFLDLFLTLTDGLRKGACGQSVGREIC